MQALYNPKVAAAEYGKWAVNLYRGCSHGCKYCYAPAVTKNNKFSEVTPRAGIIEQLSKDARKIQPGETVFLCFTCDPYQPAELVYGLTRQAIEVLHLNHLHVNILTKGGRRALRDIDLYQPGDMFGITLTDMDDTLTAEWEPHAAQSWERIETLKQFHARGIRTWVSLEPVLNPEKSINVIKSIHEHVDLFKVGKLNHLPSLEKTIDWTKFGNESVNLLRKLGKEYYIKEDLRKFLD